MSMLDMSKAELGQASLKRVPYMKMEECGSIGTPPEVMTLGFAAYAKKVITKPEYIVMYRKIILLSLYICISSP